jgi:hypothetical protein
MECILRVSGTHFQPDEFLKTSPLVAVKVWRKGEMRMQVKGNVMRKGSGINVSVAEADGLTKQIEGVVPFLRSNKQELSRLRAFPGVEFLVLDFAVAWRDDLVAQTDHLPLALLNLCSEIGLNIDVSHYSVSDSAE